MCLLGWKQAWAESFSLNQEKYRFSGFATIGAARGGNNTLGFRRNNSQEGHFNSHWSLEPDTLLGLHLDADFSQNLAGAVQLVARDRTGNDFKDMVGWAYLRYHLNPAFAVRAGRFGLDLFLLSEYRSLGLAYLWVRPPMEFYGSISFDHVDGLDIAYQRQLDDGYLEIKLFAGQTQNTLGHQRDEVDFILAPVYGLTVTWEDTHWRIKLGLSNDRFDKKMSREFGATQLIDALEQTTAGIQGTPIVWPEAPRLADDLDMKGTGINYYSLGAAYDANPWMVQAEVALIASDYAMYQDHYSSYLSFGYRVGPTTLYAMTALAESRNDRKLIPEPTLALPDTIGSLPQSEQDALIESSNSQLAVLSQLHGSLQKYHDATIVDQKTLSLGIRWDILHNLVFKVQLDRTEVKAYGSALWDPPETLTKNQTLNTYSLNLNYVF
ncbi:MAG: hypothetical protein CSA50_02880 [Gammaproteobacteria bacterium]|nr:MAG: hypothetical protein CSA50_02880 [Gammaproteobacteria bacterium]